jgi:serine/threonine protein phosphatase PrpC
MCGVPYDQRIDVPPGLRLRAVYLDERCGVRAVPQEPGRLVGTPALDGTHLIRLECADANGATVRGEAQLVISRDPRSLWRNVPSERSTAYWKPDQVSQRALCRGWRALALSRRGRAHANVGKCREDDVALQAVGEHMIAVAVADGAGSAAASRLGSHLAVTAAIQALGAGAPALTPETLHSRLSEAAGAAATALHAAVEHHGMALADLSTTLLLCVLVPEPPGLLGCLQIGDGAIAASDGTRIQPLSSADHGDYAGQTMFLSNARLEPRELATRIHVRALQPMHWVMLATDGVTDPHLETEQAMHDAHCWAPIATQLERATADPEQAEHILAQWLDAFTPGHHDDRTLVLLHPDPGSRGVGQ